jgi:hypothetical protein
MPISAEEEILPGTVLALSPRFQELEGATLEWWLFSISHTTLILRASNLSGPFGKLFCSSTVRVKILPVMRNVRIRMATAEENRLYRPGLQGRFAEYAGETMIYSGYSLRNGRCIIECDEGVFSVWAAYMSLTWTEDPDLGLKEQKWPDGEPIWDIQAPLWNGGPPVPEL